MHVSTRFVLLPLWLALFALGLLCLWGFAFGLIRDRHIGDPEVALDLARPTPARTETFRVWGSKPYALYLRTLTHAPPLGDTLLASIGVSIQAPGGRPVYRRVFSTADLGHLRQAGGDWSQLERLTLRGSPLRRWTVSARVLEPDPRFANVDARVLLRRVRYDPGMGGMMNYLLIFPAVLLLLGSALVGHALSVRGVSDLPFYSSGIAAAAVVLYLLGMLVG